MDKLRFLIGTWSGQARIWRTPDSSLDLVQTEQATYKLDGLILTIEGVGKSSSDNRVLLQALGLISFDDEAGVYHMRAFNDGRWLESDVTLDEADNVLRWGFAIGPIQTSSTLRVNEDGEWIELHFLKVGADSGRKFMEVAVKRPL